MGKGKPIVVDGSNVAHAELSAKGEPKVSNLVSIHRALVEEGYDPIIIVDATLRHIVDDPRQLEGLLDNQVFRQSPAGTEADYFVLETADRNGGLVVSNDEFETYRDAYPWIEQRRVPFMVVDGEVELYRRKLEGDR